MLFPGAPVESSGSLERTKEKIKKMRGVRADKLSGYADESLWRDRFGQTSEAFYSNIIQHISDIYPL